MVPCGAWCLGWARLLKPEETTQKESLRSENLQETLSYMRIEHPTHSCLPLGHDGQKTLFEAGFQAGFKAAIAFVRSGIQQYNFSYNCFTIWPHHL